MNEQPHKDAIKKLIQLALDMLISRTEALLKQAEQERTEAAK